MSEETQLAELQRLCERAYLILSETWDEHTDEEGYGPVSLLRDLKTASQGKELRDISLCNEMLVKRLTDQGIELEKLRNKLRAAHGVYS